MIRGIGARSVTTVALLASAAFVMWRLGLYRLDYWAQLSPWVGFLAAGFAVLAGTLVFGFWRLGERSEYYFRFGELLPFGGETALGSSRGRGFVVGHAPQVEVIEFPPGVQRAAYIAVFLCIGVITVDNRAVTLLRDVPKRLDRPHADFCREPEPPEVDDAQRPGCKLVERAYQLGYAKSLGSCAPKAVEDDEAREVCRLRQRDEPYLHYEWRLLDRGVGELGGDGGPGLIDRLDTQLDHLEALAHATIDGVAMQPRSSHHLFINLPDPRPSVGARVRAILERGCGARLAHLPHFPPVADGPTGRSELLEHVLAQLLFNPTYRPTVARCEEVVIHWDAPVDACARLAADPRGFLADHDALEPVTGVLAWRRRRAELAQLGMTRTLEPPPASRVASFQCLIFDPDLDAAVPAPAPTERSVELDGEPLRVREARMAPLTANGAGQIRLYKRAAELLAEGFGYGRLTSNQAIGARPEEATIAKTFGDPGFLLTKLDLLRDADLFLGNDWLGKRPDLLDVYPYHLHLENFVEVFRRQYKLHRGRL